MAIPQPQNFVGWSGKKKVLAPKSLGGLGVASLRASNLALLAKWWWRYKHDPSNLCMKIVKVIHISNRCYKFIPFKNNFSGPWKNIATIDTDFYNLDIDIAGLMHIEVGCGNKS